MHRSIVSLFLIFSFFVLISSYVHPTAVSETTSRSQWRIFMKSKNKKAEVIIEPEFSRVVNIAQIPRAKPVLCRLLAKSSERSGLESRFDIPQLSYFAANITLSRQDEISIVVAGTIEAHMKAGERMDVEILHSTFDTLLLNNAENGGGGLSLEEGTDYDDEVTANGNIDIGEIAAQYLALEL